MKNTEGVHHPPPKQKASPPIPSRVFSPNRPPFIAQKRPHPIRPTNRVGYLFILWVRIGGLCP